MIERTLAWQKLKDAVVRVVPIQFVLWIGVSLMFLIPIVQPVTMILEGFLFLLYLLVRFLKPKRFANVSPKMVVALIWLFATTPFLFIFVLRFAVIPIHRPASLVFVEWNPRGNFKLTKDMDFADVDLESKTCVIRYMAGTFEGNGHTVSNLSIPFFCDIESEGTLNDLKMTGVAIEGGSSIGAVARENRGTISDVDVTGTLDVSDVAGGIVGVNRGTIRHASFEGTLSGSSTLGGIAGWNSGSIRTSRAVGIIQGELSIGGIAGNHTDGLIEDCLTDMDLLGQQWVGGIAGITSGEIERVVVYGDLTGPDVGVVRANTWNIEAVTLFGGVIDSANAEREEFVYYLQNQSFDIPEGFQMDSSELVDSFYQLVLGFDPEIWDWNTEDHLPQLK